MNKNSLDYKFTVNGQSEVTLSNADPYNPISFTITGTPSNCPLPVDKINIPYEGNSGQEGISMKSVYPIVSFLLLALQCLIVSI